MADGAVLSWAGSNCITVIAKEFNIPVFVFSPKMRFTPRYFFNQERANEPKRVGESDQIQIAYKYNLIPSD